MISQATNILPNKILFGVKNKKGGEICKERGTSGCKSGRIKGYGVYLQIQPKMR